LSQDIKTARLSFIDVRALAEFHVKAITEMLTSLCQTAETMAERNWTVYLHLFKALAEFLPKQPVDGFQSVLAHLDAKLRAEEMGDYYEDILEAAEYADYLAAIQRTIRGGVNMFVTSPPQRSRVSPQHADRETFENSEPDQLKLSMDLLQESSTQDVMEMNIHEAEMSSMEEPRVVRARLV
jgi:hypothetical protein